MQTLNIKAVKDAMLAKLRGSLLDSTDGVKLKFKPHTAAETTALQLPTAAAGFLIPYFTLDGKPTNFWRYRYLEDTRKGFEALSGKKPLRYVQPKGGVNEVYLAPFTDWRRIAETPEIPIVITEGELKAACATKQGIPTIGLGGVFCFKADKANVAILPMLKQFKWKEREVIICYDSDAVTNQMVVMAENQLADLLTSMSAHVKIARLPPDGDTKVGVDDYLLTHDAKELLELLQNAEYYRKCVALHQMNERVVYIRNPGFIYSYERKMRINCDGFVSHAYATYSYTETKEDGKKTVHKTAAKWIQWPGRAELEACTFAPGQTTVYENKLNLWEGWPIEPAKGDVKPWKDLLGHLFDGASPESKKWFEQWCAYPLQNPGAKMATAAVLWGIVHGSGKTLVGHTIMKLYGKHGSEITDAEIEDDRFDWAENMQFVLADDITSSNSRRLANRLKTMITQKFLKINQKYVPRYTVPDCINYYFTSNDPDAFILDDGDRRYFIHEVTNGKIPEQQRREFIRWRESAAGIAALFHYLLSIDLTGFDPQAEAYVTASKMDMVRITKSDVGTWVRNIREGQAQLKRKGDLFTSTELLAEYDPTGSGKVSVNGMARELKRAGFGSPGTNNGFFITKCGNVRLYTMRNFEQWKKASVKEIVQHYENSRELVSKKTKF